MEGLTGSVRFGDDGRRENFTLSVVEMTVSSDIVKVLPLVSKIQLVLIGVPLDFNGLRSVYSF